MNEPTLNPKSGLVRFRLDISYDGSNYSGWARQPDQNTIQGEIEAALAKIFASEIEVIAGGRTDAGVHALGQVAHFDIPEKLEIENLAYKLNRILKAEVRINSATRAPKDFHARFSAKSRTYQYKLIDNNKVVPPLTRFDTASWYRKLDEKLMNKASKQLLGKRDFRAFCKANPDLNTVRDLKVFSWRRSGELLVATVTANAFCYSMVRNLVGAAVCVGEGRFGKEWILKVLEEEERVSDSYVFPANGLTLIKITY